jgi:enoyl-CoA hydratase/carnithine racemase
VVLTGAGERAFTAGLDLKELGADTSNLGAANAEAAEENPVKAIEQCRKPVIGAINGVAITGGFELAIACDILIASENARFADTHARVGIMPGWGLSQKLAPDRHRPCQGAFAVGQFPRCAHCRRLGSGQPRGPASGLARHGEAAGARHRRG